MGIAVISKTTFKEHALRYLQPAVYKLWKEEQFKILVELKAMGGVVLGGDGRADSPGHCTKFGSYTLVDLRVNKVVDLQLIQVCWPTVDFQVSIFLMKSYGRSATLKIAFNSWLEP